MSNNLLFGQGSHIIPLPSFAWQKHVKESAHATSAHLTFMSEEHHLVRNFVVRELPRAGAPLSPESIAQSLRLPDDRVKVILDELEKHMTFLFRDERGAVAWAYPVTVDRTPHRARFSTGETVYAA